MKKIYDPKTKQYYLVNEVLYTSFTKEVTRIRKYEQYHGQLLSLVIGRLRELDAEADKMLMIWVQEGAISDREMARRLDRKQSTFAKQIKRIRMELRIICKL